MIDPLDTGADLAIILKRHDFKQNSGFKIAFMAVLVALCFSLAHALREPFAVILFLIPMMWQFTDIRKDQDWLLENISLSYIYCALYFYLQWTTP